MNSRRLIADDDGYMYLSGQEVDVPKASARVFEVTRNGDRVIESLEVADRMHKRMKGLLGRKTLEWQSGLWITPCNSIHMFFMKFPIDVVFIDDLHQVVRVHEHVEPWKMARGGKHAKSVLELPAGTASHFKIRSGDKLVISERD